MTTYAIGDIQGCYDELQALLKEIDFNAQNDTLWLTGDLVNRGPKSLEVLRFVKNLPNVVTVLGNHDLHCLTLAYSNNPPPNKHTMQQILEAPDREELLTWLRKQPLIHYDNKLNYGLVHAGIPPQWTIEKTLKLAQEVHNVLQSENFIDFLDNLYGDEPDEWDDALTGWGRLRYIVNALTRMRFITPSGKLLLEVKGKVGTQPKGYSPWFRVPNRKTAHQKIIFGHWAALEGIQENNVYGIDTGCVWGRHLSYLKVSVTSNPIISPQNT